MNGFLCTCIVYMYSTTDCVCFLQKFLIVHVNVKKKHSLVVFGEHFDPCNRLAMVSMLYLWGHIAWDSLHKCHWAYYCQWSGLRSLYRLEMERIGHRALSN